MTRRGRADERALPGMSRAGLHEARVRVKICGLTRRADAEAAAAAGAAYGGVILAPGGTRTVAPEAAAALFEGLPLRRVGVFVDAAEDDLRQAAAIAGLDVLQLHGAETPERARALRDAGFRIWKGIRPRTAAEFLTAIDRYGDAVDGILLDGWSATAHGGTGVRFPWEMIAEHRAALTLPLIAAGGLNAVNVAEAVALLRPSVVDVSSGVEDAPGVKNSDAIQAFIAAALGRPSPRAG